MMPSDAPPLSLASLARTSLLALPRNAPPPCRGAPLTDGVGVVHRAGFSIACWLAYGGHTPPCSLSPPQRGEGGGVRPKPHGAFALAPALRLRPPTSNRGATPTKGDTLCRSVSSLPFLDHRSSRHAFSALPCGHLFMRLCLPPLRAVAPCRGLAGSVLASLRIRLSLLVPRRRSYFALTGFAICRGLRPHLIFRLPPCPSPTSLRFPSLVIRYAHCIGVLPDIRSVTLARDYGDGGRMGTAHTCPLLVGVQGANGFSDSEKP